MNNLIKSKRGFSILDYIIAFVVFGIFIVGIYFSASETQGDSGFWKNYGYTPPTANNNLSQFDQTSETFTVLEDLKCDINPDDPSCPDVNRISQLAEAGTNILNVIVQGAYGALITITKTLPIARGIIMDIGHMIGVDETILLGLTMMLSFAVIITIILIVFNRSDV